MIPINSAEQAQYQTDGYFLAKGLFPAGEVAELRDHYMGLRAAGSYPGDAAGVDIGSQDPLKRFPRMIHMHRWDDRSLQWMLDPRLGEVMARLLGREPLAVQTMLYFKPSGARGQALHQDQFYLNVEPGTCMAAWLALDDCDEENGCLQVVPGTARIPVLCTRQADTRVSFTDIEVPLPPGVEPVPVRMAAGDVFFFNGSVIHGSFPNTSATRFRRALIGHYISGEAERVAQYYHPVLQMDGTEVSLELGHRGGRCGAWVDRQGNPEVELVGSG